MGVSCEGCPKSADRNVDFPVGIFMVYCGPYKGFVGMGSVGRGVTVLDAGGKSDDRGGSEGTGGEKAMRKGFLLAVFVFSGKYN